MKRRCFNTTFKAQIVQDILAGEKTATQIAFEHKLSSMMLTQRKTAVVKGMPTLFDQKRHAAVDQAAHETQMQELMGKLVV